MEILNGLGNLTGPLIGAILYTYFGFRGPFFGVAIIFVTFLLMFSLLFGTFNLAIIEGTDPQNLL
jgi:MFS family permease